MKRISIIILALVFVMPIGCDRDKFARLNSNPSQITEPDLRFSMTKAIEHMSLNDYTIFFYNKYKYLFPWAQIGVTGGGNGSKFNEMGPADGQNIYGGLFPQTMDIRYRIDNMEEGKDTLYRAFRAITYPVQIVPIMFNSDLWGSVIYSEAGLAPYTTPPLLKPKFDNQQTLYDIWLKELDASINELGNLPANQVQMGNQDVIYNGDYGKWAKFCNLLKLKVAARLINQNRAKALKIAEEVAGSPVGYMNELDDDFIYKRNKHYFGTGNGLGAGYGAKRLVSFMCDNLDPRVRFLFKKNSFNKEVVQAFIKAGKKQNLPPYVSKLVNFDASGDFDSWKAPGEPWVRYHGVPVAPDSTNSPDKGHYFKQAVLYKITLNGKEKTYGATSACSEKLFRTTYKATYPTEPGGRVLELLGGVKPLNVILASSAETNLYLAEFKLLGANLPESAQAYFERGIRLSVERMDKLAENNDLPYYRGDPVYGTEDEQNAGATKLKDGEIEALLSKPAYDLTTGSDGEKLEKVYIQQYINFAATPADVWTLVRRSGIPKKGSSILPWEPFYDVGKELVIPRRFGVGTPTENDYNYDNKKAAFDEQGFTTGTNEPAILNSERLWFDRKNPAYGEGPKL